MFMREPMRVAVIFASLVAGDAVLASGAPHNAPAPVELVVAARPGPGDGWRADMDLRRWPADGFHRIVTKRIDALSAAHGPERPRVFLDMAELYLGHALLYEAGSILDGVEAATPRDKRRWRAMRDAVLLLQGEAAPEIGNSPLAMPARPDRGMWLTLQAIATGDEVMLRNNLAGALQALEFQTRPIVRAVLPIFTEAAVEAGETRLAQQAVSLLEDFPDLSGAPVGHFLRGREAEVRGQARTALERYFAASDGWDFYAARARLALADMAMADGGRGALLAARDVLEYGGGAWRGDQYERDLLLRLGGLYSATGDPFAAVVAHGKLMSRFPGSDAAVEAAEQARIQMAAAYREGAEGQLPLAEWLPVHISLVPLFRYFPEFALHSETLADYALKVGGTDLAAGEYRRAISLVEELEEVSGRPADPERLVRLRVKLARALSRGGRFTEARDVLDGIEVPQNPDQRQSVNALKASVLAELGDFGGVRGTYVSDPDAAGMRDLALALWEDGRWEDAIVFYRRLRSTFPEEFTARDASYLLLAARKSGDEATAGEVVAAFPGLTDSATWVNVAASLIETPAPLSPLSREAADTRLESAERAVGTIGGGEGL